MKQLLLVLFFLCLVGIPAYPQGNEHTFSISGGAFLLDGNPFQIISGELHYARIPKECWRDRLRTARSMGLNTISTYVFWNLHEPEKGKFNFSGNADLAAFIKIARQEGLWVILRPGPYACAEWEFGGYPYWLLNEKGIKVRSRDSRFLEYCGNYLRELGKQVAGLQVSNGGAILMVQLENEYGSFGNDKKYLERMRDLIRAAGFTTELFTCDGPAQMEAGSLPGILPAVNGLDNIGAVRETVNRFNNGQGPYFIAEWYPGWFDSWGKPHHTVPASRHSESLDSILTAGYSVNLYMAHGGTTRGFMNGANMDHRLLFSPQTSSYDYDAPINEAGNRTAKYFEFREIIRNHLPSETYFPPVTGNRKTITLPPVRFDGYAALFDNREDPVVSEVPLSFEEMGQDYGYVLYETTVTGPGKALLRIESLRDYAVVYLNNKRISILDRRIRRDTLTMVIPAGENTLSVFVENMGRINYGPYLNDNRKGMYGKVLLDDQPVKNWKMYRFPMADTHGFRMEDSVKTQGPVLKRATFTLAETGDCFLDMRPFGKGCAWVNGKSLGRYWSIGPQQTLYIPSQWLNEGKNVIEIFELYEQIPSSVSALDYPILDELKSRNPMKMSLSTGKTPVIDTAWSSRYSGGGKDALVNGFRGSTEFDDGCWQGYEGSDLSAVVDLGTLKRVVTVTAGFLQDPDNWIYFPSRMEVFISADGVAWDNLGEYVNKVKPDQRAVTLQDFSVKSAEKWGTKTRFVKVIARNLRLCPPKSPGAGQKSWLFADEILIQD